MWATYVDSLQEAFNRRVAQVVFGVALLIALIFNVNLAVQKQPNGQGAIIWGSQAFGKSKPIPFSVGVPLLLADALATVAAIGFPLVIFAVAPMLAATFEKGWLELIFSKATSRWKIFLGRFLAGASLYTLTLMLGLVPLAIRLWCQTGIMPWRFSVAFLIETFGFAAVLSVAALTSLMRTGPSLPIIAAATIWLASPVLAERQQTYYRFFRSPDARKFFEWIYKLLPKSFEIGNLSREFVLRGEFRAWEWPIWSTGLFMVVILSLTFWLLHRKSF